MSDITVYNLLGKTPPTTTDRKPKVKTEQQKPEDKKTALQSSDQVSKSVNKDQKMGPTLSFSGPIELGNNINDPARLEARYQLPVPGDISFVRTEVDASGFDWDQPIDDFAKNLGSGDDLIENVAAVIDRMDYEPNSLEGNAFRRPINEVWQGLDSQGECSDIHNVGAYLLNQNGVEAYTVQIGRTTGPHNVLIYQNEQGSYDIMEYGKIYDVKADSPEEAMRKIQNDRMGTIYRYVIYEPTKDGFEVRSIGQGRAAAFFDQVTESMNLNFNKFVGGNLKETGAYIGSDGIQVKGPDGWKFSSRMEGGKLENLGIGKFNTNEAGVTSGFSAVHDRETGMVVGQYQRKTDQYKWLSTGLMYHSPMSSFSKLGEDDYGQIKMPTLVPFFGGSYGGEKDLVNNETLRLSVNSFIQGRAALPIVLTEKGREITGDAQNGNVPWMDGGQLLGFAQLKTGVGSNLDFKPWQVGKGEVQLSLGYGAKYEISDPTLIYRDPTAFLANTGRASLSYKTPVGDDLQLQASVSGQVTDSKYIHEQNRLDSTIKLNNQENKWGVGVSGSVAQTGYSVGANGYYMFNEKVGLMGGAGYDSVATRLNPEGNGFNVGIGTIYKF